MFCQVCLTTSPPKTATCPRCGEASWKLVADTTPKSKNEIKKSKAPPKASKEEPTVPELVIPFIPVVEAPVAPPVAPPVAVEPAPVVVAPVVEAPPTIDSDDVLESLDGMLGSLDDEVADPTLPTDDDLGAPVVEPPKATRPTPTRAK